MSTPAKLGLIALLAAFPLLAQDAFHMGISGGVILPQGDLKTAVDSKMGFSLGVNVLVGVLPNLAIRPRIDYLAFPSYSASASLPGYTASGKTTVTALSFGADALWFLKGHQDGLFLEATLATCGWKEELESTQTWTITRAATPHTASVNESRTWNKLAYGAGVGYRFDKHFALEGRYLMSKIGDNDSSANHLQALVSYLF